MEDQNQVVFLVTLVRKDLRHDGWGDQRMDTGNIVTDGGGSDGGCLYEPTSLRVCYVKVRWSYGTRVGLCVLI